MSDERNQGVRPDDRYDIPGPLVEQMEPDGWYDEAWWQLNHGYYGLVSTEGHARWVVEAIDGFGIDDDPTSAEYPKALRRIDACRSAVSHIVAHHGGCERTGIRLRVREQSGELFASSFDSRLPLGVVHADGSFSVDHELAPRRIEPHTGLDYR